MIRVGFILSHTDDSWIGGINYLTNLLHAVAKVPDRKIEPVLIVSRAMPDKSLVDFPPWEVHRTALADNQHFCYHMARKLGERFLGRDVLMERYLQRHGIKVLSHSGQLGRRATIPTIGWVADFQHRRMPEFFQGTEIAARERGYRRIVTQCNTVLISSKDAQKDLAQFAPGAVPRSRVLHFAAGFKGESTRITDELILRKRYGVSGPFFYLPNQFWAHKNHRVVVTALRLLKSCGRPIVVLCSGHTNDRRQPTYFTDLMRFAVAEGVSDCFKVIGLVPFADVASLMMHSVGVINPSLFEGWSTTVEESKSLGITVVLSDIPVHREQNPERGVYFDPRAPASLAAAMTLVVEKFSRETEDIYRVQAAINRAARFEAFGTEFQSIVINTLQRQPITNGGPQFNINFP